MLWLKVLICSVSFVSPVTVPIYFYPSEPQDISGENYISARLYLLTFNSHLVQKPFTSPQNKMLPLASIIIHLAFEEADRSVLSFSLFSWYILKDICLSFTSWNLSILLTSQKFLLTRLSNIITPLLKIQQWHPYMKPNFKLSYLASSWPLMLLSKVRIYPQTTSVCM